MHTVQVGVVCAEIILLAKTSEFAAAFPTEIRAKRRGGRLSPEHEKQIGSAARSIAFFHAEFSSGVGRD